MINYLKGTVTVVKGEYIVLESQGLGYTVKTGNPFAFEAGKEIIVYTHMYVHDDCIDLYGFKTAEERDLFLKLISVRGIGPKGALAIIAGGAVNKVMAAINNGDAPYLQRFPGIGPKTSKQIILDLNGKLDLKEDISENQKIKNIKDALKAMGYKKQEIKSIIPMLTQCTDLPIDELLKEALKKLI